MKTDTINTRIDPELKANAEKILSKMGISSAEAVRMFYNQICLHRGIPFDVKVPNAETIAAMEELKNGGGERFSSTKELFASWRDE